jgi:GT2 family glycosyltransferase/glycosyltransferase involved in cell wall biosynthesis
MTRRIALVTDEFWPCTHGGIGRVLHNLVADSLGRDRDIEFHLVVPKRARISPSRVAAVLGSRVHVHTVEPDATRAPRVRFGRVYAPPAAYTDTPWHAESLEFLFALKQLAVDGIRFDVVEFPDYRGWAFCTIQEKRLGIDFQDTEIAVRLHSTVGIIARHDGAPLTNDSLGGFELERKALRDADRVVAHLTGVARFNQAFYGFDGEWLSRTVIEFPPVAAPATPLQRRPQPDVVFATKIQPIKAPELFVRGAATFLRERPDFTGRAVVACHAFDQSHLQRVRRLVPEDLRARFAFTNDPRAREAAIRGAILVVPSAYESLNLVAYEGAAAGATLVLNARCVAFGDETPFRDGENCVKFDGSVEGLARAIARAWEDPPGEPLRWAADRPYWEVLPTPRLPPRPVRTPRVSVVITNHNLARYLPETLATLVASDYADLEVVVVDDASTDPFDREVLARIEADASAPDSAIRLVRNPVNRGLPSARNLGIASATGEYILPLDADDCIAPGFVATAVAALEASPDFDVVVPTTAYFDSDDDLGARRFADYAVFVGDAPTLGLTANRLSTATALLRRSVFDRFQYRETLTSFEDWDLYLRLALDGRRFLVTNDIQFHYRRRSGSMVRGIDAARHLELLARVLDGLPTPIPSSARIAALLVPTANALRNAADGRVAVLGIGGEKPLRYSLVDRANTLVKAVPGVHGGLKRIASWAKSRYGSRT